MNKLILRRTLTKTNLGPDFEDILLREIVKEAQSAQANSDDELAAGLVKYLLNYPLNRPWGERIEYILKAWEE